MLMISSGGKMKHGRDDRDFGKEHCKFKSGDVEMTSLSGGK